MLKKTITYEDLDGKEYTEDFYFNISQTEFLELEMVHVEYDGFKNFLTHVTTSGNGRLVMETFKDIVAMSYGKRSDDGKAFIKTKEDRDKFMGSEAYEKVFTEIITEPSAAAAFVNGLLPKKLQDAVAEEKAKNGFRPGAETLPKSRRDQLEAERLAQQNTQASPPVQVAPDVTQQSAPVPLGQILLTEDEKDQIRRQARLDFEAEQRAAQQNPTVNDPSQQPWNGVDGLPQQ